MHQVFYPSLEVRSIGLPVSNESTNEDCITIGNNVKTDLLLPENKYSY